MFDLNAALMSPGMAMAGQAIDNLGRLRQGQATVSPIQAYQQAVQQQALQKQREQQLELQRQRVEQANNPRIGTYNPRDYTPESFATFLETQDPNDLERQQSQFTQGGIRYDPMTGQPIIDPTQAANLAAGQAGAIKGAQDFAANQEAWLANESKLLGSIDGAKAKQDVVSDTIADALPLLSEWTTSYGGLISSLPATEAKRLRNLLDTIRANVAFTTLQDMRANSPTGGALGQVSERELDLLMSAVGSLDQTGDMADLEKVLRRIERINQGAVDRMEDAYERDRGRYNPNAAEPEDNFDGWSIQRN